MTPDYFAKVRRTESGGNDRAKNPRSSATGRYQFIDSTWNGLAQRYPHLGLTDRFDPDQQERAMQVFTSENQSALERAGIPIDGGSLYSAHFLGAGGAINVLGQPDQTALSAILPDNVMRANPFLRNMTVGAFRKWSANKHGGAPVDYDPGQMPQDQRQMAQGNNALGMMTPADFGFRNQTFELPMMDLTRNAFA